MQPAAPGDAAASVRDAASSLARMLETWTDTVLVLMKSCLPISPLLRPSATSARISDSRGVSAAARRRSPGGRRALRGQLGEQRLRPPCACAASRARSAAARAPAASPVARRTPASRTRVWAISGTLP